MENSKKSSSTALHRGILFTSPLERSEMIFSTFLGEVCKMKCFLFLLLVFIGCSDDKLTDVSSLDSFLKDEAVVKDNVIACAANSAEVGSVDVFFYPRVGAEDFRLFETNGANADKNDFLNYTEHVFPIHDVFNGYLKRFQVVAEQEKWVIIAFREDGKIHISNPIRLKHLNKPTQVANMVTVDKTVPNMPLFSWEDGIYDDTAIYFQVITDADDNLLSGTYTYEKTFQYYNLDNVVLNVTRKTPPSLNTNINYSFTLMAVSEDNWVNLLSSFNFTAN